MKRSRSYASSLLFVCVFTAMSIASYGQSIIRQSIGSIGASSTLGTVVFQASVGQCFGTLSSTNSNISYRPGFIQPIQVKAAKSSSPLALKVFPNPAVSSITVEGHEVLNGVKLEVMDLHGRIIETISRATAERITIDCSSWSKGTYIIRVQDASNKVHTSKIIINN